MQPSRPLRVPRSAADATRFTATGPYAYSRPNRSSNITARTTTVDPSFPSPPPAGDASHSARSAPPNASTIDYAATQAPPNETPQQKVARLREAARRAKLEQEPLTEKILRRGRVIADKAHRVTVMGFIGLSALCTGLAIYATADMTIYNRRKRRLFLAEQQRSYNVILSKAYAAEEAGELTPDLAMILNKERAMQQWEEEQRNRKGALQGLKEWAFGGMARSERGLPVGLAEEEVRRIAEGVDGTVGQTAVRLEETARERGEVGLMEGVRELRREKDREGFEGRGMLDELAEGAARDVSEKGKGWWDWVRRR